LDRYWVNKDKGRCLQQNSRCNTLSIIIFEKDIVTWFTKLSQLSQKSIPYIILNTNISRI
jgi:hypothetical protein